MAAPSFKSIEKKLRNRKYPIVLADIKPNFSVDTYKNIIKISVPPKDLAEVIYELLIKNTGSAYLLSNTKVKTQCISGRARSIQDLFNIVVNYKPNISYEELYKIVEDLKINHRVIGSHYCITVRREVYFSSSLRDRNLPSLRTKLGNKNIKF